jgi:hypothetical protein
MLFLRIGGGEFIGGGVGDHIKSIRQTSVKNKIMAQVENRAGNYGY